MSGPHAHKPCVRGSRAVLSLLDARSCRRPGRTDGRAQVRCRRGKLSHVPWKRKRRGKGRRERGEWTGWTLRLTSGPPSRRPRAAADVAAAAAAATAAGRLSLASSFFTP
ncbi:hypothetical protein BDZ90DRAFT_45272 [Jaminaea rosea]|uniref:Uncharacterized protein n=1 Tax=Jaminaea rosea TaxID=1569628 RepID=A0A316UN07_9BASI|nr:hypothetical protein BDZ90DRAFT_45272 [Jaminaea rosea]PWN26649.1 hypothetical protein BDZ90DRAFT_45272 [Jaminaea rosea]